MDSFDSMVVDEHFHEIRAYDLKYYILEPVVDRVIFDSILVENIELNHDIAHILYDYIKSHQHNIDTYIIDKLLPYITNKDIIRLVISKEYNKHIISIIIKYVSIQELLLYYLSNENVNLCIINYMVDKGAVLYKIDCINAYFKGFNRKSSHVVDFILKNGVPDNNNNVKLDLAIILYNNRRYFVDEHTALEICKLCISHIEDINQLGIDGNNLLYHAISSGYLDIVIWLLENGANINTVMRDGDTCLGIAMNRGSVIYRKEIYLKILEIILKALPSIDCIRAAISSNMCENYNVIKICIKYFMMIDYSLCDTYTSSFLDYIIECKQELEDIRQMKLCNMTIYELIYKNKNTSHILHRYSRHPSLTQCINKEYKIYTEVKDNIANAINRRNRIDEIIDYVSTDDNLLSRLPFEIRDLIISQSMN
ncbi:ankyrin [Volepox virus]|uniref:Ankyrin n=1 Tax=Volepox virus TaxID=28874 RepID=A0A1C9KC26_9POXV|nr:ankyrin [Volepox virus]AOP31699.1 ankyrin [Volepox virus]